MHEALMDILVGLKCVRLFFIGFLTNLTLFKGLLVVFGFQWWGDEEEHGE